MKKKFLNLSFFLVIIILSLPASVVAQGPAEDVVAPNFRPAPPASVSTSRVASKSAVSSTQEGEAVTAFQRQLQEAINQRKAAGLPVPSVTYESEATPEDAGQRISSATTPGGPARVTGKTVIQFDGPEEAGLDAWPPLIINKIASPDGQDTVEVDLTEAYREFMEEKSPGIWETYEFGQEPRKHTIVETFEVIYPEESSLPVGSTIGAQAASTEDILMGFTYTGPKINASVGDKWEVTIGICPVCKDIVVAEFKAGVELKWALGLRLPAEANLVGPDVLVQGSPFNFSSALTPRDWSEADYNNFGVAPEGGNEFVARLHFFVGIEGQVLGQSLCKLIFGVDCHIKRDYDFSKSFVTPFGSGSAFPIGDIPIEPFKIVDIGLITWDISLQFQPKLGSDKITADWQASGDASGNGQIAYSGPGSPESFGPVNACNLDPTSNLAQIQLTNFQYFFNKFLLKFTVTNRVTLHTVIFGDKAYENPQSAEIDLSSIFGGLDLHVGAHVECPAANCTAKGPDNTLNLSILVVDLTPPTTTLTPSGTPGNNGWYVSDVQVSLSTTDLPAGCGVGVKQTEYSFDGTNWNIYSGPFTISDEGATTVYYRSIDNENNVEATKTQVIKIDKTPPTITGAATTAPNAFGWYNTDVVVHFEAFDAVSGIDTVTPDQTLSGEGANQSVTGTAVDIAGNSNSFTVTGINIDKTKPDVSISSPEAKTYDNTESFNVVWTASDNLSGIASESGALDGNAATNGQLIQLLIFAPGPHTVEVEAVDKADNVGNASVTFNVVVDSEGLLAAVEFMCDLGWINKGGICNGLEAKLKAAIKSVEKGNLTPAENQLEAFLNELKAQKGKAINQQAYDVLKAAALYVIDHLADEV